MKKLWMLAVILLQVMTAPNIPGACAAGATPAPQQQFNFDGGTVPASWKVSGGVTIDPNMNHGAGPGGSLKAPPGATAVLNVSDTDRVGKIDFWIYDDGSAPADPKAPRDGPTWGIQNADGTVETVGVLYAAYLSGGDSYAVGTSPDGKFLYRNVVYLGINRKKGWHEWTFTFDNTRGWTLFYDGKDVNANSPRIIEDNVKARGFTSIRFAGDTGADHPQTLWVDDVTVDVTGPLTNTGVPESRVMSTIPVPPGGYYAKWTNGPPKDPNWFPIGVWLQNPDRAAEFKAIGIDLYVGLWDGPTEDQLAALKKAGMPVICAQNSVALKHLNDPTILAWLQDDEPDNAQADGKGGYGPPTTPAEIVRRYNAMHAADPTRPVYLGLGQGVAWDNWVGRGVRTNKPDDYPLYAKGGDIISFDIYPVVNDNAEIKGKLWKVPFGVERLVKWTDGQKPVWNDLECTRISNPNAKPTPAQVRAEVWMSLIHGSHGIIYFVHQFKEAGGFIEAALLSDKVMSAAVARINKQIMDLAPVLNSPNVGGGGAVASSSKLVPVDVMIKRYRGATYVFAVAMRNDNTHAQFQVKGLPAHASAEALGENRKIAVTGGKFGDNFNGYEVHLYKIAG
ncbi:MAG TPA: hypothetical protein VFJ58_11990 [Armatimonadota bacterium]|nr:hypothetical protein [Armatimonadota bacterium]